jgi:hypothetical protein
MRIRKYLRLSKIERINRLRFALYGDVLFLRYELNLMLKEYLRYWRTQKRKNRFF